MLGNYMFSLCQFADSPIGLEIRKLAFSTLPDSNTTQWLRSIGFDETHMEHPAEVPTQSSSSVPKMTESNPNRFFFKSLSLLLGVPYDYKLWQCGDYYCATYATPSSQKVTSFFAVGSLRDVASFYATISKRMEEFPYFSQIRGYNGRFIGVLKFKDKDAMERSKYEDLDVRDTPLYESVVGKKASQEPRLQGKNVTSAQEYSGANISSRQQEDSGYNGTSIRPHQREESDYHGTSIRPHQQQEEIYYNSTSIQPHQQEDDESNLPNDKCEDQQSQQIQFAHPPRPHADSRRRERYRSRRGDPPPHRTWEDIRRSCSVF